jgi:hypothetical protein
MTDDERADMADKRADRADERIAAIEEIFTDLERLAREGRERVDHLLERFRVEDRSEGDET